MVEEELVQTLLPYPKRESLVHFGYPAIERNGRFLPVRRRRWIHKSLVSFAQPWVGPTIPFPPRPVGFPSRTCRASRDTETPDGDFYRLLQQQQQHLLHCCCDFFGVRAKLECQCPPRKTHEFPVRRSPLSKVLFLAGTESVGRIPWYHQSTRGPCQRRNGGLALSWGEGEYS